MTPITGTPSLGQRDRDDELRHALDEFLGAVERIDDPYAIALKPLVVVGGLLGKPSVVGKGAAAESP